MKKYNRKSQMDLTALAIGLLILGLIVAIGSNILIGMRDNQRTEVATLIATNETVVEASFSSANGDVLTKGWANEVITVGNETGEVILSSGNYTTSIDPVSGMMAFKNASANIYGDNWKVTYSYYDTTDPRYSLPENASLGLGEMGNWFDIIVIVGIAGLVIGLIFLGLGKTSGGSY